MTAEKRKPAKGGHVGRVTGVIAAMLVASVVIRLADGTGAAIAREIGSVALGTDHPAGQVAGDQCLDLEGLDEMLAGLGNQRDELQARKEALDLREGDLKATELAVRQQLEKLATAEDELRDLIAMASTASENDVGQLTSVYENMKPKEAAAVFEEMAPDFAAGFLARMRPESAARILAGLKPSTAYSVSAILAGRNANAPTD